MDDLSWRVEDFDRSVIERDADLAGSLLSDDFALVVTEPAPRTMSRERWLAVLRDYAVTEWTVLDRETYVAGACALVLSRVDMVATVLGADRSGLFTTSDLWLRHSDGGWYAHRRISTPGSAGHIAGMVPG
ncbi:nuclear transport factor 2 family protein [Nocardioides iriomotensis]|uniref:nuclear transport factor 2 family protein n=1 Tax=Nocardioides iriomotensis TaxID=715784 RepID=UPI0013EAE38C|nr:nuclear transport factor 2 family protein [Nocardioides iriomotensis]